MTEVCVLCTKEVDRACKTDAETVNCHSFQMQSEHYRRGHIMLTITEVVSIALKSGVPIDEAVLYQAAHDYNRDHGNELPDEWVNKTVAIAIDDWQRGGRSTH